MSTFQPEEHAAQQQNQPSQAERQIGRKAHPLSLLPGVRHWPSSPLLDILYTLIWNSAISVLLTILSFVFNRSGTDIWQFWWPCFVISNSIGFLIHFCIVVTSRLTHGWPDRARGLPRAAYMLTLITLCILFGISLGMALLGNSRPFRFLQDGAAIGRMLPFAILAATFIFAVIASAEKRIRAEAESARQRELIAANAVLLAQAQLRALQAQIEPHFLYNTLANVVSLIEQHPATARHMLERLIDFLRANLAASRAEMATLGSEAELARAYLDLMKMRMGTRLGYRIGIADSLRHVPLAPMLLQPLIENAICHGLEPKIEGGEICLSAEKNADMLVIQISDTGIGIGIAANGVVSQKTGGGVGMSNLRARLQSLYGGKARLQLLENTPSGVIAKICLPMDS
jgi:sensor histidine kinase YesM